MIKKNKRHLSNRMWYSYRITKYAIITLIYASPRVVWIPKFWILEEIT
jgi:hypothetical protein